MEHQGSMRTLAVAPECMVVVDEDRDMERLSDVIRMCWSCVRHYLASTASAVPALCAINSRAGASLCSLGLSKYSWLAKTANLGLRVFSCVNPLYDSLSAAFAFLARFSAPDWPNYSLLAELYSSSRLLCIAVAFFFNGPLPHDETSDPTHSRNLVYRRAKAYRF